MHVDVNDAEFDKRILGRPTKHLLHSLLLSVSYASRGRQKGGLDKAERKERRKSKV
jgi:hypothetical protein